MTADQFRTVLNELPGSKGFDHEVDFLVSAVDANGADADRIIYMDEYMAAIVPHLWAITAQLAAFGASIIS